MDDIKELRKKLKLELNIHNLRKCEYCDWQPTYCEWCDKLVNNNKRKICATTGNIKKKGK